MYDPKGGGTGGANPTLLVGVNQVGLTSIYWQGEISVVVPCIVFGWTQYKIRFTMLHHGKRLENTTIRGICLVQTGKALWHEIGSDIGIVCKKIELNQHTNFRGHFPIKIFGLMEFLLNQSVGHRLDSKVFLRIWNNVKRYAPLAFKIKK